MLPPDVPVSINWLGSTVRSQDPLTGTGPQTFRPDFAAAFFKGVYTDEEANEEPSMAARRVRVQPQCQGHAIISLDPQAQVFHDKQDTPILVQGPAGSLNIATNLGTSETHCQRISLKQRHPDRHLGL